MSRDQHTRTARTRRASAGLAAAAVVALAASLAGCGAEPPTSTAAMPANETTARIAAVEVARQCVIVGRAFAAEADITVDLETRLTDAGLTYAQWKDWHDALEASPGLVEQYAAAEQEGCPGA